MLVEVSIQLCLVVFGLGLVEISIQLCLVGCSALCSLCVMGEALKRNCSLWMQHKLTSTVVCCVDARLFVHQPIS